MVDSVKMKFPPGGSLLQNPTNMCNLHVSKMLTLKPPDTSDKTSWTCRSSMPITTLVNAVTMVCLFGVVFCLSGNTGFGDAPRNKDLRYERDVRPIFKAMCFQCHGEEPEPHGNLDLRLVRFMMSGGESGHGIVATRPEESLVWKRIESDEMPEGSKKLTPEQKETIRLWIEQGARTLRPEPEKVEDARYSEEELNHWAFHPPKKVVVPVHPHVSNPIDAFIVDKLKEKGVAPSPSAERQILLRRLKLDLHGLPPTRQELDAFLANESPDAYEKLVDELLDSPQFGVRWARHWLDVAGYSESDGNQGKDRDRDHAWRYRDYVIDSFNADKPYDQFIQEQMAGDEMINGTPDANNPQHVEWMTATGLLRMAPDVTSTDNALMDRNQAVADVIKVVSSAVLGLSVGCAQCHDHRYDPISIDDYYQFRAIFDPAFPLEKWKQPDQRLLDMTTADVNTQREEIEADAVCRELELKHRKRLVGKQIFDLKIAEVPEDVRASVIEAVETPEAKRNDSQKKLLLDYPMAKSIDAIVGQLVEFDKVFNNKNYKQFEKERKDIVAVRETKPSKRMIMAVSESADSIPESAVFFRGDPQQRKQVVQPSEIFVIARNRSADPIPPKRESIKTTGRRLTYARQLTDGSHPLVARVVVNRLWQHHFGTGLVATPNDFGAFGRRPTHPELLDYLANDLVENGWSLKRLHKQMVMSHTYRQCSTRTEQLDALDTENGLYGRMHARRMDAEQIRDSMLLASGKLHPVLGGPSVPVAEDAEGKATIGRRKTNEGLFSGIDDVGVEKYRRSIYLQSRRSLALNFLETFDLPVMNPNCDTRRCSTVAPQSLLFLNDESIIANANELAESIWSSSGDLESRIQDLFLRLFSESPTPDEVMHCLAFAYKQREIFANDTNPEWKKKIEKQVHAPDVRALASLCQVLMASNRFLYVD